MSQLHYITSSHKKGRHLSFKERIIIQLRIKDNYSIRAIAREIGCSPTTVSNEIKRGTIPMYKNCSPHYRAKAGQAVYDAWSLDACCGRAVTEGKFNRDEMVCIKTLYTYVDAGLIGIKPIILLKSFSGKTSMTGLMKTKDDKFC